MTRAASASASEPETLRFSRDFRRVLRTGARSRQGAIVMVRSPGRPGPPRVGLIVPRDAGKAVRRNRVRRRLRHALRALQLEPAMDYVIIASAQTATVQFAHLVESLERAHRDLSK